MHTVKTCFGYCPIQNSEYFMSVKYSLCDINTYAKSSGECVYQLLYHAHCPMSDNCPIFKNAPDIINSF